MADEEEASSSSAEDDLYAVLGVRRDATVEELSRAYKRLAQVSHPDKHRGGDAGSREAAAQRFSRLRNAFEVLSDANKCVTNPSVSTSFYADVNPNSV